MRKLIVGMLTAEAWSEPAADGAAAPTATSTTGGADTGGNGTEGNGAGGNGTEGSDADAAHVRSMLRWTADIDLADPK